MGIREAARVVLFISSVVLPPLACDRDRGDDALDEIRQEMEDAGSQVKDEMEQAGEKIKDKMDEAGDKIEGAVGDTTHQEKAPR